MSFLSFARCWASKMKRNNGSSHFTALFKAMVRKLNQPKSQAYQLLMISSLCSFSAFTMPLSSDEYILDVTTELLKTNQPFYLIFCRSVWHFPLKKEPPPTPLYIEVLFNQVAPDYLEGLLLEIPNMGTPSPDYIRDIARIAAILHRAADLNHIPVMKEIKFLLPKPALSLREIKPTQWVNLVQAEFVKVLVLTPLQCKAQFLSVLSAWPLFGSSFFAVKRVFGDDVGMPEDEPAGPMWRELILAINHRGVLFLDSNTHETLHHWQFIEIISTRKVNSINSHRRAQ
jgi:myosin XV